MSIFKMSVEEMLNSWPLKWVKNKCEYANQKSKYDFLFDGNSKVFPIC